MEIHKTNVGIRTSILEIPCVPIFRQTLSFWTQICPKRKLGFGKSASLRYYENQFSEKTNNLMTDGPNLPKNEFWGRNFKNLSLDLESTSLRYYEYQFSDKTDNFEFLGPNLPKSGFWGRNLSLSLDLESASLRYYVHQYSDKTENFEFLGPNLPKSRFWGQNFKNQSLDSVSPSLRYYVYQFSDKLWIYGPKFAQK